MTNQADMYIPKPLGGALPIPEAFASHQQEREHRKRTLAAAFRVFGKLGLAEGIAGHITVRDPEFHDHLWVNPYAVHFSKVRPEHLIRITEAGEVVEGDGPINAAAVAIHCGIHSTCPSVVAAVHTHSVYGRAFSALRQPLLPLNQESCAYFENQVLFQGDVVVLSGDEGTRIGRALGTSKSAIMLNHGLLTVGSSVEAAAYRFIAMERCCQIQLLAQAAGTVHALPDEEARQVKSQLGSDYVAWLGFRGLMDVHLED
ncbi:class II aldolase/adducin family protein [Pseudomonas sp.]|jgi:ribulose-5-phosphate 4-epimerase/fuculose-1-phosphate aldolase|uniref:class II aldolase/adducin family protein n=1 Tax=Pseudomonas sp. TaxID=306 RepID=UPI003F2ED83F